MNPLVSVGIITYNQKDLLKLCLKSVLEQNYQPLEIVIADDGSTDGTHEMLRTYDEQYPGLFVLKLSKTNLGITHNCNLLHYNCSGKYIAWMGGDDLMLPNKLQLQTMFMEANPDCKISYHNLEVFQSETDQFIRYFNNAKNSHQGNVNVVLKHGTFNGACSAMVRRDAIPPNGFNTALPVASDWLYWIEILANGGQILYIDKVLGKYRRHAQNVTNANNAFAKQALLDHLNTVNIVLQNYPQHASSILYRYSEMIRGLRLSDTANYFPYLLASVKINFNIRSLIAIMVYFFTFKKIKI